MITYAPLVRGKVYLLSIYDKVGAQTVLHTEKSEVTFLFAGAAIALALVAGSISLLWFNRLP